MIRVRLFLLAFTILPGITGCATQKQSHTSRTGVEQLLISSAVDRALDSVNFAPLQGKNVYVETKYLDCVDKNYVTVAIRQRILRERALLVDKPEQAEVVVEICSGGVGTDSQELFVGIPEIPLPPPSPISIPRLAFLTRTKLNGTAKLLVNAYEAKTKRPVFPSGLTMARSDQNDWNFFGMGPLQTGSLPTEITAATKEMDLSVSGVFQYATGSLDAPPPPNYLASPKSEPAILPAQLKEPQAAPR